MATYVLVGAGAFAEDLQAASRDVQVAAARVVRDTAQAIASRARAAAPRDRGDLQATIGADGRGLTYRVGIRDVTIPSRGGTSAHQTPWVYGVWYEYGFTTRRIPTRPFMRPAADAEDEPFTERMSALLRDAVRTR